MKLKVKWQDEIEDEQDKAIECIAQVANLLAPLRGNVSISANYQYMISRNNDNQGQSSTSQQASEFIDFEI